MTERPQPFTLADLLKGEQIVRELHGLHGYDAWAERIAKAIAAEREAVTSRDRAPAKEG